LGVPSYFTTLLDAKGGWKHHHTFLWPSKVFNDQGARNERLGDSDWPAKKGVKSAAFVSLFHVQHNLLKLISTLRNDISHYHFVKLDSLFIISFN